MSKEDALLFLDIAVKGLTERSGINLPMVTQRNLNASGKPQCLYLGRVSENDQPEGLLLCGRSEVKDLAQKMTQSGKYTKSESRRMYKSVRKAMMDYDMGQELPVLAVGADESIAWTLAGPLRPNLRKNTDPTPIKP